MKEKKVQVSEGFLCTAMILAQDVKMFFTHPEAAELREGFHDECADEIMREVDAILEARARRGKFTEYKTAKKSSAEREKLRREYLDMAGVHKNWRSEAEQAP